MSEYPFLHNLIVVAYQSGKADSSDFNLLKFIKNSEEDFEDWIYSERLDPLEQKLKTQAEEIERLKTLCYSFYNAGLTAGHAMTTQSTASKELEELESELKEGEQC